MIRNLRKSEVHSRISSRTHPKMEDDIDFLSETPKHTLFKTEITLKNYLLNIGNFDHFEPHELKEIERELSSASENDSLVISISSGGGYLDEFLRLKQIIEDAFYGRITTKLEPYGFSAGSMIFLIGDYRIIYPESSIMFHDATFGVSGKHSDIKVQANFQSKQLEKIAREMYSDFLTDKELQNFFNGEEFWLDAEEMCKRKICTAVRFMNKDLSPEAYLEILNKTETGRDILKTISNEASPKDQLKIMKMLKEFEISASKNLKSKRSRESGASKAKK